MQTSSTGHAATQEPSTHAAPLQHVSPPAHDAPAPTHAATHAPVAASQVSPEQQVAPEHGCPAVAHVVPSPPTDAGSCPLDDLAHAVAMTDSAQSSIQLHLARMHSSCSSDE
jgi:hypothetical protein